MIEKSYRENQLLRESRKIKREADRLLEQSNLPQSLTSYGRVKITGNYKLNLMLNGDIDINIVNPKFTKTRVLQVFNQLVRQSFFKSYHFYDFIKFKQPPFPAGYYIFLRKNIKGQKWKIDLWFLTKDDPNEVKTMKLVEQKLTPKTKLIILKLKNYRDRKNLDLPSATIYRLVFQYNITMLKQFKDLVKKN